AWLPGVDAVGSPIAVCPPLHVRCRHNEYALFPIAYHCAGAEWQGGGAPALTPLDIPQGWWQLVRAASQA
ncbi:MAG TPA: hypothetical protein VMV29_16260, partial [Ktedonobacterales bacterium]|nr:hypothetical protein [Ktedonobacterales bacterium]